MKKQERFFVAVETKEVNGKKIDKFVLDTHDKPRIYLSLNTLKKHNPNCSYAVAYRIEEEIKIN